MAIGIAQGRSTTSSPSPRDKVPLLDRAPLAANPTFQLDLATADTELRAAERAAARDGGVAVGDGASTATSRRSSDRARVRAAAVWATERAAAVVDTAYRAGGGSSLYLDSPLQRRLRDIHAVTQHFLVRRDTMTTAGAILAGNERDLLLF